MHRVKLFFCLALLSSAAQAISLELTHGINAAQPIVLFAFSGPQGQAITQVVADDLNHSGRFKVTLRTEPEKISAKTWAQQGQNNLVQGRIQQTNPQTLQASFRLVNTVVDTQKSPEGQVLLHRTGASKSTDWRRLAHAISNQVYEKLTGERGVFNTKIAYIEVNNKLGTAREHRLIIADQDGNHPQAILRSTAPIMSPAWSPDGRQIAYVSFEKHRSQVYISNIFTGTRRKLTDYAGINGAPAWSPDGKKLAIVLSRTGFPKIYTIDLNTLKLTQQTKGTSIDTEPSWRPDGKALLFTSNRGGSPQIYEISLDTHAKQRMTFDGRYNSSASYSPDGHQLIFLHRDEQGYNIASLDLETGAFQRLTQTHHAESPSVAPNGSMILYAFNETQQEALGIVSLDGRIALRLPAKVGSVQGPAWSPYLTWQREIFHD